MPSRSAQSHAADEETRALTGPPHELLDADTTDYWDDEQGLPPPHRLSSHFSPSPYPSSHDGLPLAPPRPSTSAYIDPFANTGADDAPRASMSYQDHHDYYPPHDVYATGGRKGYLPARDSYDSFAGSRVDLTQKEYDEHAWGMSASQSQQEARDRYLARKDALAATGGAAAGYGAYNLASKRGSGSRRKWWLIGLAVLLLGAAGVGAGVYLAHRKTGSSKVATDAVKSDPNDPSKFEKDPKLHRSFYGMCYTPLNAQYPACGDSLDQVVEDVQILSQLTPRIRTYGADCDVPSLVLEAIQKTKVDLQVYLAVWVDDNAETYKRQVDSLTKALKQFGADHVDGVIVGNEVLLNGGSEADLISKMADMRTTLAGLGLGKTVAVGTSDAGSKMTTTLGQGSDFVFSNTHPWFAGTLVSDAAGWVWSYTHNEDPSSVLRATNSPTLFVGEVGWPTGANETAFTRYEGAVAGTAELQTMLDTFVCQSNANVTAGTGQPYFFFEAFDEEWKDALYGGVESHWGLMGADKKLKQGLTIPNCATP